MTTVRQSPDTLILTLLHDQPQAAAAVIGEACHMTPDEVRSRLVYLESLRLVMSHQDAHSVPLSRPYAITTEGRRKVDP